ncbi:MAG TPA: hypothetical protein VIB49_06945 [Thermoplasmata archaeon]
MTRGVQEVWLIRQEGDLLYRYPETPNPDAEYLAQRLIATHQFVRDSLSRAGTTPTSELTFGNGHLAFVGGRFLVLVVLVVGRIPRGLRQQMEAAVDHVEETYASVLSSWQPGRTLADIGGFLLPLVDPKAKSPL